MKKLLGGEFDKEIILLSISKKDIEQSRVSFKWIHSKEFRFNGKLYDIKRNISDSDSLRFYCYYDNKENLLEELFNKYSKDEKEKNKSRVNNFIFFSFIGLIANDLFPSIPADGITYLPSSNSIIKQIIIDVLTPPPQYLLVSKY